MLGTSLSFAGEEILLDRVACRAAPGVAAVQDCHGSTKELIHRQSKVTMQKRAHLLYSLAPLLGAAPPRIEVMPARRPPSGNTPTIRPARSRSRPSRSARRSGRERSTGKVLTARSHSATNRLA